MTFLASNEDGSSPLVKPAGEGYLFQPKEDEDSDNMIVDGRLQERDEKLYRVQQESEAS